jgi:hypothetical protein
MAVNHFGVCGSDDDRSSMMVMRVIARFVQRGSLWDMLRRSQADPSLLPWSRRLKFAAEVTRVMCAACKSELQKHDAGDTGCCRHDVPPQPQAAYRAPRRQER